MNVGSGAYEKEDKRGLGEEKGVRERLQSHYRGPYEGESTLVKYLETEVLSQTQSDSHPHLSLTPFQVPVAHHSVKRSSAYLKCASH